MALTLAAYWRSGAGDYFSIGLVVVGGLIAGFLARRYSADVSAASLRAGVIGGLAGYVWIAPSILATAESFADAWSFAPAAAPLFVVFSAAVVGLAAVPGLVGGLVGAWVCSRTGQQRAVATSS